MTTVLAHGVFDLLHPGHIEHLRQAKAMGDELVVTVTDDPWVNKGPGQPVFTALQRMDMLMALEMVDDALVISSETALDAIARVEPNIYVKGPDYANGHDPQGNLALEKEAVEAIGGKLAFTTGRAMSSTALMNRHMPRVSQDAQAFLSTMRSKLAEVMEYLEGMEALSVWCMGEPILDEYIYVQPEGRSAKEAVVTWRVTHKEVYKGGISAIAAHLKGFCHDAQASRSYKSGVRKSRYVYEPFGQKVFSYVDDSFRLQPVTPQEYPRRGKHDLTVIADYGHGMFDAECPEFDNFTALTVQANSLNWGLNTLEKWSGRALAYVVIDEQELRLLHRDPVTPIEQLLETAWAQYTPVGTMAVTQGHRGCMLYSQDGIIDVPVFSDRVVDRMGAGDAFLAITAPLAKLGAAPDILGLVGNIAGALQVATVGNRDPIDPLTVKRWVLSLLK